jgi:hypothetical protein
MKKNLKLVAAATTALGLLFGMSCRKTPTESVSTTTPTSTTWTKSALFAGLRTAPFKFSVDAGVPSVGYGPQGTKLIFYANSFKDASGNIVSSGKIDIELTEMYTPGAMIANNAVTTCNGQLLRSGGQVKIKATQSGKEVFANRYGIGFKQPAASSVPMRLFYSNNNSDDSTTTWQSPDTLSNANGQVTEFTDTDTTSKPGTPPSHSFFYKFDSCTKFNWVNCDYFYNSTAPKTTVSVDPGDSKFSSLNTSVFLVFTSVNAVSTAYRYGNTASFTANNFPVGLDMKVVIMSKIDEDYYYAEKTTTLSANMTVSITPVKSSLSSIISNLASF